MAAPSKAPKPLSPGHPFFDRPLFLRAVILGLLSHAATLMLLFFLVRFWNAVLVDKVPWQSRWADMVAFLISGLAGQGFRFFYLRWSARLGRENVARWRSAFWRVLLAAPVVADREKGETAQEGPARVRKVADALEPWFSQFLPQAALAAAVPLLILVLTLLYDPLTALVLAVTGPLMPVFLALIGIKARGRSERQWQTLARLRFVFLESLHGLRTLKIFGRSAQRLQELEVAEKDFRDKTLDVLKTAFLSALVLEWGATLGTAIVAVEIALRLMADRIAFHDGLLVLLWTPEFFRPLRQLGLGFHASLEARTALKDNEALFAGVASGELGGYGANAVDGSVPSPDLPCVLRVEVDGHQVATVSPGNSAVITGPSGTGKTRFLLSSLGLCAAPPGQRTALLPRLPWSSIGWLPQSTALFSGTLRDNLCPHGPLPPDLIFAALERVRLRSLVESLPGRLDYVLEENGRNFSGGERRRLALVRLLLLDRPVWILDEPLAGLDDVSASAVMALLDEESKRRTVLQVSHHVASLARAPQVLFLVEGTVVAVGSHDDLLRENSRYRATVKSLEAAP